MSAFAELTSRVEQVEMLMDLLYSVVERTHQEREGYYALRQINDLMKGVGSIPDYTEALQYLDNVQSTIKSTIDRLDR